MDAALDAHCADKAMRDTDPFFPDTARQQQIDCDGFDFFGAPRKAEFVFADDALIIVWILTEKAEEAALIAAFKARYGPPSHDTPAFTASADDNAAVRSPKRFSTRPAQATPTASARGASTSR